VGPFLCDFRITQAEDLEKKKIQQISRRIGSGQNIVLLKIVNSRVSASTKDLHMHAELHTTVGRPS